MNDFVRTFKVGPHRVTLIITLNAMRAEWEPFPRRLSRKRMAEYLKKRDACLKAYATRAGISILALTPDTHHDVAVIEPDLQP